MAGADVQFLGRLIDDNDTMYTTCQRSDKSESSRIIASDISHVHMFATGGDCQYSLPSLRLPSQLQVINAQLILHDYLSL